MIGKERRRVTIDHSAKDQFFNKDAQSAPPNRGTVVANPTQQPPGKAMASQQSIGGSTAEQAAISVNQWKLERGNSITLYNADTLEALTQVNLKGDKSHNADIVVNPEYQ